MTVGKISVRCVGGDGTKIFEAVLDEKYNRFLVKK
jgi:hypothetical protein